MLKMFSPLSIRIKLLIKHDLCIVNSVKQFPFNKTVKFLCDSLNEMQKIIWMINNQPFYSLNSILKKEVFFSLCHSLPSSSNADIYFSFAFLWWKENRTRKMNLITFAMKNKRQITSLTMRNDFSFNFRILIKIETSKYAKMLVISFIGNINIFIILFLSFLRR